MTVMKFWWKVIVPSLVSLVLMAELYVAGVLLMNQPDVLFVFIGGLTLTSIVLVAAVWASWVKRSLQESNESDS